MFVTLSNIKLFRTVMVVSFFFLSLIIILVRVLCELRSTIVIQSIEVSGPFFLRIVGRVP